MSRIMGLSQMGLKKQKNVKIDLDNPNFQESNDETYKIEDMVAE